MKDVFRWVSSQRRWLYYVGIGLGATLFLQQLWHGSQAVQSQLLQPNQPSYLMAAVGATFMAYTLQMIAWAQIMHGLGISTPLLVVLEGYAISFLPRYIPGTVWGYLSRGEWFKSNYNVPYAKSTFGSVLEISLTLLTVGVIAAAYYCWSVWPKALPLILLGVLLMPWPTWYSLNLIPALLAVKRFTKPSGLHPSLTLRSWWSAYSIYLMMWIGHGLSLSWLLNAFGVEHSTDLFETTFFFSFAWLVGFVILIVPSGLGVREFALSSLLIFQYKLPPETASAIAVNSRLSIYLAEIAWLILSLLLSQIRPNNRKFL